MGTDVVKTLCRICLGDDAILPIFIETDKKSIQSKLTLCLQEEVKDIDGFPKNICETCNRKLENACNFIKTYKDSNKILENGLLIVKQEKEFYSDYSCNGQSETEIEEEHFTTKSNELSGELTEATKTLFKLKPLQLVIKKLKLEPESFVLKPQNKSKSKKKLPIESRNKTNKIASSLLEGDFIWSGEHWCLKPKNSLTSFSKAKSHIKQPRKATVIKILKKKVPPALKLCDLCGEVFKTQYKLTWHKKVKHGARIPAKCPHCTRLCASEYYLKKHIRRKHEVQKFMCAICERKFAFLPELKTHHKNVHEKHLKPKKTYKCSVCNKTYKCMKSVIIHERSVHSGQRPATCIICGSSFFHEDYLKEHMRLHTGETPFKCPICGRGYAQRGNMKSHIHHNHKLSDLDTETRSKLKPSYIKLMKV